MPTIARLTSAYAFGVALGIGWFSAPTTTFLVAAALFSAIVFANELDAVRANGAQSAAFALAGVLLAHNAIDARVRDCRNTLRDGALYTIDAVLLEEVGKGSTPITLRSIGGMPCKGELRMLAPFRARKIAAGAGVRVTGS